MELGWEQTLVTQGISTCTLHLDPDTASIQNNCQSELTLQTKAAVVVLPTPGGPESNAALKLVPSSLPPVLLVFAIKEDSRFYLGMYYKINCILHVNL